MIPILVIKGKLPVASLLRSNRLFTAEKSIIIRKVGYLNDFKIKEIENLLTNIFKK